MSDLRESRSEFGAVAGFVERCAGHEDVGTGAVALGGGAEVDAAVNFEPPSLAAGVAQCDELLQLGQHVAAKWLAAETGLHGHDQHQIDLVEQRLDRAGRRVGIKHDPALAAERANAGECGGVVVSRLDVDADKIGPGLGKWLDIAMGFVEHEVHVEENFHTGAAQGGNGFWPKSEIRHEMAVHDVDMQPRKAEIGGDPRAGGEVGVIAGKERGCEDGRMHGKRLPNVEHGVCNGVGQRCGEEREGVVFRLELTAVRIGFLHRADGTLFK
jgi:hypothetical protein